MFSHKKYFFTYFSLFWSISHILQFYGKFHIFCSFMCKFHIFCTFCQLLFFFCTSQHCSRRYLYHSLQRAPQRLVRNLTTWPRMKRFYFQKWCRIWDDRNGWESSTTSMNFLSNTWATVVTRYFARYVRHHLQVDKSRSSHSTKNRWNTREMRNWSSRELIPRCNWKIHSPRELIVAW